MVRTEVYFFLAMFVYFFSNLSFLFSVSVCLFLCCLSSLCLTYFYQVAMVRTEVYFFLLMSVCLVIFLSFCLCVSVFLCFCVVFLLCVLHTSSFRLQ
jgi:hypothetical protein